MNKYLLEILRENNTIIIPGLGALTITNKDTGETMFMPYLQHDDGVLAAFISEKDGVDEIDAKNMVAKYVREIRADLDKGESVSMFGLGEFVKADDGDIEFTHATNSELAKKRFESSPAEEISTETQEVTPIAETELAEETMAESAAIEEIVEVENTVEENEAAVTDEPISNEVIADTPIVEVENTVDENEAVVADEPISNEVIADTPIVEFEVENTVDENEAVVADESTTNEVIADTTIVEFEIKNTVEENEAIVSDESTTNEVFADTPIVEFEIKNTVEENEAVVSDQSTTNEVIADSPMVEFEIKNTVDENEAVVTDDPTTNEVIADSPMVEFEIKNTVDENEAVVADDPTTNEVIAETPMVEIEIKNTVEENEAAVFDESISNEIIAETPMVEFEIENTVEENEAVVADESNTNEVIADNHEEEAASDESHSVENLEVQDVPVTKGISSLIIEESTPEVEPKIELTDEEIAVKQVIDETLANPEKPDNQTPITPKTADPASGSYVTLEPAAAMGGLINDEPLIDQTSEKNEQEGEKEKEKPSVRFWIAMITLAIIIIGGGAFIGRNYNELKQHVPFLADDLEVDSLDTINYKNQKLKSANDKPHVYKPREEKVEKDSSTFESDFMDEKSTPNNVEKPKVVEKPKTTTKPKVVEKPKTVVKPKVVEKPKTTVKPKVVEKPNVVEKPKVAEKPKLSASSASGPYHIITGSFSSVDNANRLVEDFKKQGYTGASVVKNGELNAVSIQSYATSEQARADLSKLKGFIAGAWVLYK